MPVEAAFVSLLKGLEVVLNTLVKWRVLRVALAINGIRHIDPPGSRECNMPLDRKTHAVIAIIAEYTTCCRRNENHGQ